MTVAVLTTHWGPSGWNDTSRWATAESLVTAGSLTIDNSVFAATGDKVFVDGHFYSDKPPMAAVFAAVVYWPLHQLGITLHVGRSLAHFLVTLVLMKGAWLLGALAFHAALRHTPLDPRSKVLATLALAVGSLYFTWSATLNNHLLAASGLAIGFCFLLDARFGHRPNRHLAAAGLCLALAGTIDVPTSIFFALFGLYVLRDARLRAGIGYYLFPGIVISGLALAMNYSIHGSVLPVNVVRAYFEYPGSPWAGSDGLTGMEVGGSLSTARYAVLTLIGPRGFLLYNPFLWIALLELGRGLGRKGVFYYEGVVIASGSLMLVAYYMLMSNNYAGWSYSIRWFVPLLPLLLFFLYSHFEAFTEARAKWFTRLLALSGLIALVGVMNPWSDPGFSPAPVVGNLVEAFERVGRLTGRW